MVQEKLSYATKTWRYLRIAIVLLVVGLGVAVVYEVIDGGCNRFLTSISAYYYTPVHAYFVGALVSIGVCLFCIKGNTEWEDIFLNLAGVFAPVVALVPTPDSDCPSEVLFKKSDIEASVANNMTALFVAAGLGLIVAAALSLRNAPPRTNKVGFGVALTVFVAALVWFSAARGSFVHNAHNWSAGPMFACIIVVVLINARGYRGLKDTGLLRYRYDAIGIAMVIAVAVLVPLKLAGWDHAVLVLEAVLITLFATFWVVQTRELWHDGLRAPVEQPT